MKSILTNYRYILILLVIFGAFSCVPARQYQDEKAAREKAEAELADMKTKYDELSATNTEMEETMLQMEKEIMVLENDTTMTGISLRKMIFQYDKLNSLYEELNRKHQELLALNMSETEKISTELQLTQEKLNQKEAELLKLENELNLRKQNLDQLQADLLAQEKRIIELEAMLHAKDSVVKALKDKLTLALEGFENNGLTIVEKNGKIYVSMDESLLFASGSWTVNAKGKDTLNKLETVLAENPDINIMVEGHTDNVPYKGSGQVKDNWDLSVMRATSVTKIILNNTKVDPSRITAAGRSEYVPLDPSNNSEARSKNRRTEIILTPKLDELLQILESN